MDEPVLLMVLPDPPDGTELPATMPAPESDGSTPAELRVIGGRVLRQAAGRARRLRYKHVLDPRLMRLIDPEGLSVIVCAYPQTGGFWRCQLMVKLSGSDQPLFCWADIPADTYSMLPTWGQMLEDAGRQRGEEAQASG